MTAQRRLAGNGPVVGPPDICNVLLEGQHLRAYQGGDRSSARLTQLAIDGTLSVQRGGGGQLQEYRQYYLPAQSWRSPEEPGATLDTPEGGSPGTLPRRQSRPVQTSLGPLKKRRSGKPPSAKKRRRQATSRTPGTGGSGAKWASRRPLLQERPTAVGIDPTAEQGVGPLGPKAVAATSCVSASSSRDDRVKSTLKLATAASPTASTTRVRQTRQPSLPPVARSPHLVQSSTPAQRVPTVSPSGGIDTG